MPTTPAINPMLTARRVGVRTFFATSGPLLFRRPEEASRSEDQYQHQDAEGHHGLELVGRVDASPREEQDRRHGLEDSQEKPTDRRSGDASDPSEHGGGERLDAREEAHREYDLVEQEDVQDTGR